MGDKQNSDELRSLQCEVSLQSVGTSIVVNSNTQDARCMMHDAYLVVPGGCTAVCNSILQISVKNLEID
jgi:hypothetical protein